MYVHTPFLNFALEHNKPVLVAESAPQGYDLEESTYGAAEVAKTPDGVWDEWYVPFFAYVHDNAGVIRAVAYINVDWNSQPMWQLAAVKGSTGVILVSRRMRSSKPAGGGKSARISGCTARQSYLRRWDTRTEQRVDRS